jgi:hypothetical protein
MIFGMSKPLLRNDTMKVFTLQLHHIVLYFFPAITQLLLQLLFGYTLKNKILIFQFLVSCLDQVCSDGIIIALFVKFDYILDHN